MKRLEQVTFFVEKSLSTISRTNQVRLIWRARVASVSRVVVSTLAHPFSRTDDALSQELDIAAYMPRVLVVWLDMCPGVDLGRQGGPISFSHRPFHALGYASARVRPRAQHKTAT